MTVNSGALVSVVIPCYNQARFLPESIGSIRNQTYGNFEIIVVDDGSTDGTSEAVQQFPDVAGIRQPNRGISGARNTGFRASKGDYLVFLDADDRLLPDALEVGVEMLTRRPECGFAYGRHLHIAADGSPLRTPRQPFVERDHYAALLRGNFLVVPEIMYSRRALAAVGAFNEAIRGSEDYELALRITREFPVVAHTTPVFEYRQHAASHSQDLGMMLKTTLAVVESHRAELGHDPVLLDACRAGKWYARNYFGSRLVTQVKQQLRRGEWSAAARDLMTLMRYYPAAPVDVLRRRISALLNAESGGIASLSG